MTRARETSENARQAKAWVTFNGGLNSIMGSFNVSSITDVPAVAPATSTVGKYTVSFENNMDDVFYTVVSSASITTDGRVATVWPNAKSVGSVDIYGLPSYSTIAYIDINSMDVAIFS